MNSYADIPGSSKHCGGIPEFLSGGKVGNYLKNPATGGTDSFYNMKSYPLSDFCFVDPGQCPLGVTFAFWLDIIGENTPDVTSGFFTTMRKTGPGFSIYWNPSSGLLMDIRRGSDTYTETVNINRAQFLADYGFGTWVHYIITYRFDGTGNNMEVYVNGVARPKTEKTFTNTWSHANTRGSDGEVNAGHRFLGACSECGYHKIDEIIIFEEQIPAADAYRLYTAYP